MARDREVFRQSMGESEIELGDIAQPAPSDHDLLIIKKQIGRESRGVLKVVRRCSSNYPQVIMNSPVLKDGTIFPTLFWLSCPFLKRLVSRLEASGWIKILHDKLAVDQALKEELDLAHADYSRLSRSLLGSKELKGGRDLGSGICGVKDLANIKCLHAHYAHYLATGKNPIGRIVDGWAAAGESCSYCDRWER